MQLDECSILVRVQVVATYEMRLAMMFCFAHFYSRLIRIEQTSYTTELCIACSSQICVAILDH